MGKPYINELGQLESTYRWATMADISRLRQAVITAGSLPLIAIGSGGSLTAAHFLAGLHRRYSGQVANVATPLEVMAEDFHRHASIWLLSAGGGNVDINAAFDALAKREPAQLGVICGRPESPLVAKACKHNYVDLIDFTLPTGKDGFLATNSLLAFCVMIARAYAETYNNVEVCFGNVERVGFSGDILNGWKEAVGCLWLRPTTIVLHGIASRTGAIDLESKFTEAAIGNLQVADYRNFAHGRHHWLAKHSEDSGILAFTTPVDRSLAERTLALIPANVPITRIDLEGDYITTSLASLVAAIHITGWAGISKGVDPGRPGVPAFGRKLYNLPFPRRRNPAQTLPIEDAVAIERKAGVSINRLVARGDLPHWQSALATFRRQLKTSAFFAVISDYDGTLVDTRFRNYPPTEEVVVELIRILEAGVLIGIATGRGASVRRDLQSCLPRHLWGQVIIGYYNGAVIAPLEDNSQPDGRPEPGDGLVELSIKLHSHPELREICVQEDRLWQITLKPRQGTPESRLWDISNEIMQIYKFSGINIVRSSHSIDILAPGVSKTSLIKYITDIAPANGNTATLKIGDRGRWPGNDFALLREPFSLSVDELSVDPFTCWNLAPRGQRGVQATLNYCHALKATPGGVKFDHPGRKL